VPGLSRAELLRRGGRGGAAVLLAGPALTLVPGALGGTPSENDLAYARLFVACELLACDFYRRALGSRQFGPAVVRELRRSLYAERRHLRAVGAILLAAGQIPAKPGDIDFVYPRRAFASRRSTAAVGARLESLFLGAYLGAVTGFDAGELKTLAARAAASEAQHLGVLAAEAGGESVGAAFPRPLTIDRASDELDEFTA
jgi:ferritin-like protein